MLWALINCVVKEVLNTTDFVMSILLSWIRDPDFLVGLDQIWCDCYFILFISWVTYLLSWTFDKFWSIKYLSYISPGMCFKKTTTIVYYSNVTYSVCTIKTTVWPLAYVYFLYVFYLRHITYTQTLENLHNHTKDAFSQFCREECALSFNLTSPVAFRFCSWRISGLRTYPLTHTQKKIHFSFACTVKWMCGCT